MINVNTDNIRIVGGMNTKSISSDVDDIPVEVDFEEDIITVGNTDYTKENLRDIIKCLREVGYAL